MNQILVTLDRARFMDAVKAKSIIASRLADYLGDNIVSAREQNECFHAEQGPYDQGRLWCQAATVIRLNKDVGFTAIGYEFVSLGDTKEWASHPASNQGSSYELKTKLGVNCDLELHESGGKRFGNPARSLFGSLENRINYSGLAIACADRAKAAYYPLVD